VQNTVESLSLPKRVRYRIRQCQGLPMCLSLGVWAGIIFSVGIVALAALLPHYSQVRQTVSELGEVGSPARLPFAILLCTVSVCLSGFAMAIKYVARDASVSSLPAFLVGSMALSAAGVGIFAYPNPMHNVFGLSELLGHQAPLAMALTWRHSPTRRFSWIMYGLIALAMTANISVLDTESAMWRIEKPVYGVVQRSIFMAWFVWSAGTALILYRSLRSRDMRIDGGHRDRSNNSQ
jgi:hypothetical membrane protein